MVDGLGTRGANRATMDVVLQPPPSGWLPTVIGGMLLCVGLAFFNTATYTSHEAFQGQLVPEGGMYEIRSPLGGYLKSVRVAVGTHVRKGDPLFEVVESRADSPMGNTGTVVRSQFDVQRLKFNQEIARSRDMLASEKAAADEKIRNLQAETEALDEQISLQLRKAEESKAFLAKIAPLRASGVISEVQYQQQKSSSVDDELQLHALRRQRKDLDIQLASTRQDLGKFTADNDIKLGDIQRQMAELTMNEAQDVAQRESVVRSPMDGTVSNLAYSAGQAVKANELVATVVPTMGRLYARVLLPSRAVANVSVGGVVYLRFRALPYQRYGKYMGRISEISSAGVVSANEDGDAHDAEALFTVRVSVPETSIEAKGVSYPLLPGMALDVDLPIEERTIFQWMFSAQLGVAHER